MIAFHDDENKTNELSTWATLTEVSEALGIPRNAIRSAARRAIKREELWVKKEGGKILIDTRSDTYKDHARDWREQKEWDDFLADEAAEMADFPDIQKQEHVPCYWYPLLGAQGYRQWPEFCHWLASQGLSVFFNLLAEEQATSLQWQWGDLHGKGCYADLKEAIIAALDCKLNTPPATKEIALLPFESESSRSKEHWPRRWFPGREK